MCRICRRHFLPKPSAVKSSRASPSTSPLTKASVKHVANGALLPFMELIAGIGLMLYLNWQLAAVALLIFPITLIGPRILTPKAVQANYEQKVNEFGHPRRRAGECRGAGGGEGVRPAAPCARLVLAAQPRGAREHDPRNVPLDHGRAHRHDLGADAAPDRAGDRRLSRHHRADLGRHLRHLRERVLGNLLQHRAPDAFHSGGDPGGRGDAAHAGTARRACARLGSAGRARHAADHARHHLRPRQLRL